MADSQTPAGADAPQPTPPVVVKKYANRRLYNTETSSYITLDNLAEMIRAGRDFVVYDAKSGDDITRGVLTQIIVEEESKGSALLPTNFLRQLIGFYGGSLQGVVPNYLEEAMSSFARQQQQMRQVVKQTFGPFMPATVEEIGRQNMALMERAMSMFNPFHRAPESQSAQPPAAQQQSAYPPVQPPAPQHPAHDDAPGPDVAALQHEIDSLRAQLTIARAEAVAAMAMAKAAQPAPAAPDPAANIRADPPTPAAPLAIPRRTKPARKA